MIPAELSIPCEYCGAKPGDLCCSKDSETGELRPQRNYLHGERHQRVLTIKCPRDNCPGEKGENCYGKDKNESVHKDRIVDYRASRDSLWDEFIECAQQYVDTGQLDTDETNYKLEIGRNLAAVRALALSNPVASGDWREHLKQAINDRTNNLINARFVKPDLTRWFDEHPDEALNALRLLWAPGTQQIKQRVQAMATPLNAFLQTKGAKTNVVSVLLMGLDAKDYPPYRATPFDWAYEQTGYPKPDREAEEGHCARLVGHVGRSAGACWGTRG